MPRGRPKRRPDPAALAKLKLILADAGGSAAAARLLRVHYTTVHRALETETISRELAARVQTVAPRAPAPPADAAPDAEEQKDGGALERLLHLLEAACTLLPEALAERNR